MGAVVGARRGRLQGQDHRRHLKVRQKPASDLLKEKSRHDERGGEVASMHSSPLMEGVGAKIQLETLGEYTRRNEIGEV